ncbi:hypothetical protein SAMN04487996_107298 [Dyadobacter soli]|uniref:TonB-dependent outer membrane receptor, SusC/RagA subfamily, signature region n=1 Tax=Dyadobacter soli TaxID=659014 RepID=A0A1G7GLT9_9BACT|nr:hypothetical protein [Dyadobacter soli]SDE89107.1 hypothetical protein SAMN04487996_107298 [Dyadobacter soli]
MKGPKIAIAALAVMMSCAKDNIITPSENLVSKKAAKTNSLKLLYIADGVVLNNREELMAIRKKDHKMTIHSGNSAIAMQYGDRAKSGLAVITTKQ